MAAPDRNRLPVVATESHIEALRKLRCHTRIRVDANHIVDIDPKQSENHLGLEARRVTPYGQCLAVTDKHRRERVMVNGQGGGQKVIGGVEGREVGRLTTGRVEHYGTTRVGLERKVAWLEITMHHASGV